MIVEGLLLGGTQKNVSVDLGAALCNPEGREMNRDMKIRGEQEIGHRHKGCEQE